MNSGIIYLVGTSGHPNFGDEFIAAAWLRHLAVARPDADVWLDSPQPGMAQLLFEGLHPRLRVTNTLWRLVHENAELPAEVAAKNIRDRVTGLGTPAYDLGILKMREAESLHLIGGGYVNETWPHHAGLVVGMRAVGELTGARLFATGQGLMPALSPAFEETPLFGGFSYARARDEPSAATYGLDLGLDDAFLGAEAEVARADAAPGLYVCIQNDMVDPGRFESAVELARAEVERAISEGIDAYYVEAIPGFDRTAYERLADLIPEERFVPFLHVWTHGLPLSDQQTWVTSRFHLHLLAAAAGARGIAVGMKKGYYDVKHESVTALGSGWPLALDGDSPAMPTQAGPMAANLPALLARKRSEAESLYPAAPGEPARPASNTAKLFNLAWSGVPRRSRG
ncbi:polysaccharide pyruvyl transferase family protein [Arthrobacter sp. AZCC_0090]|uniref:polysaccharide pyruvyl transferase family protein n=1 Tax=Arthrobacter sp. AZCC_0090 TaxID=2735881 RepID=UPI00160FC6D2|nr:polysaccharide pyruvyl transferase family protein [Arthrobacter sp. AZCC_0090]MBB6404664.1 polysaccharide pyruvyl transferase WcaK-like protein [Arthrobacter sp. AZCC_0090]